MMLLIGFLLLAVYSLAAALTALPQVAEALPVINVIAHAGIVIPAAIALAINEKFGMIASGIVFIAVAVIVYMAGLPLFG